MEKEEEVLRLKAEVNLLSGRPVDASTLQDTSILQDDKSVTSSCKSVDLVSFGCLALAGKDLKLLVRYGLELFL